MNKKVCLFKYFLHLVDVKAIKDINVINNLYNRPSQTVKLPSVRLSIIPVKGIHNKMIRMLYVIYLLFIIKELFNSSL